MNKIILVLIGLAFTPALNGQDTSIHHGFTAGYTLDTYLQLPHAQGTNKELPDLFFNYKKLKQPSVNLFLAKFTWIKNKWELHTGLMAGDYARFNLATEPRWLRHVYELYVHFKISDKIFAESGILNSHIGFESVPAKDNWNAGRSMLAENSPYYETGARFGFRLNEKWSYAVFLLNGWQHMADNNHAPAFGTQIQYRPSGKILVNLSGFAGNERKDHSHQFRFFQDLFCTIELSKTTRLTWIFDAGTEKKPIGGYDTWGGSALLLRQQCAQWLIISGRTEWFSDKHQVVSKGNNSSGFSGFGCSLNTDVQVNSHFLFRLEGRLLHSEYPFFQYRNTFHTTDKSLLAVMSFSF